MYSEHMGLSHKHIAHEANKPTRLLLSPLCQGYYTKNDETKIVWKRFENANKHKTETSKNVQSLINAPSFNSKNSM